MTDEMSPEFLAFSEMLDQEEGLKPESLDSDGRLLLELRQELRDTATLPAGLPSDFARTTATAVTARFHAQSPLVSGLVRWESLLRVPIFSPRGLGLSAILISLFGLAARLLSLKILALGGALLLVGAVMLKALYAWRLPESFESSSLRSRMPELRIPGLYYLLPLLAMTFTSALVGRGVAGLDQVSLSFRASSGILPLAGIATTAVTFLWLVNAFTPLWRAAEQRTFPAQLVVWGHGAWLGLLALGYLESNHVDFSSFGQEEFGIPEQTVLGILTITTLIAGVAASREKPWDKTPWLKAIRRAFVGFLVGIVPLFLAGALLLRFGSTREFKQEEVYRGMVREVEDYLARQRAIPAEQNGMTELRPFFFKSELDVVKATDKEKVRQAAEVADRLRKGNLLWRENVDGSQKREDKDRIRNDFLRELPRIESAISKPYFSYISEQELSLLAEVPNFILCRSITQALAGLSDESLLLGDSQRALGYLHTNLRWSSKINSDSLIGLMISIAQRSIVTLDVERFVFEGHLKSGQLAELAEVLRETAPRREDLRDAMLRETYTVDKFLLQVVENRVNGGTWTQVAGNHDWSLLYRILPTSYWESERLAYLNLQLDQSKTWEDLGNPNTLDIDEVLMMNMVAAQVTPNFSRAQVQFMRMLTRFAALETVVALERCRLDQGAYPKNLDALVPKYLKELPKDAIHPNRWEYKPILSYRQIGAKYELVSESPLYRNIKLAPRQVYGPDGNYEEAKT